MLEALGSAALRTLLLAFVVEVCLRAMRIRHPQAMYAAWTAVLAASLAMPAFQCSIPITLPPLPGRTLAVLSQRTPSSADAAGHSGSDRARINIEAVQQATRQTTADVPAVVPQAATEAQAAVPADFQVPAWRFWLNLGYLAVTSVMLARLLVGSILAWRLLRAARPLNDGWTAGGRVRVSAALAAPVTIGSCIILPADCTGWSVGMRQAVLAHEQAHVRGGDFYVQLLSQVNRAIFWFSPLSWWLHRRLITLAESVSDNAAIAASGDRPGYARILLDIARRSGPVVRGVAMARPATVGSRIERILADRTVPTRLGPRQRIAIVLGVIGLASVAALSIARAAPPSGAMRADRQVPHTRSTISANLPVAVSSACAAPAAMSDGWPVAAPATEGLAPGLICSIGPTLEKIRGADANGVVVVRHGDLVYEHYFVGGREWGPDSLHAMHSVTKSVTAILVGIALDRGYLTNIDAPVLSFFPHYAALRTADKGRITLHDLLTMTSGLKWPESAVPYSDPSNILRQMMRAPDPYRFVLQQPVVAKPGTLWNYNSGGVELLGVILQKVSGQKMDKFAKDVLFDPLGIKHWTWVGMGNDKLGASFGLWLRPLDLAKIGQLVLNRGAWHGHRIVSAAWIRQMTAWQASPWKIAQWGGSYGDLWWRGHLVIDNQDVAWVGGDGYGGQLLYVVPSLDLVVAVTAGAYRHPVYAQWRAGYTALTMAVRAAIGH